MLALTLVSPDAAAQFNPQGRKKPGRSPTRPPAAGAPAAAPAPDGARKSPPQGDAAGPSREALIARYLGLALRDPSASFPLQRLTELYRERDGNVAALITELESRSAQAGADQANARLVLAGVLEKDGRGDEAIALYRRVLDETPALASARLALGRLLIARRDVPAGRAELERALPSVKERTEQEQLLRELLALALDAGDYAGARSHHQELVKRANGSFYVHAELGRELLARGRYAEAVTELTGVVRAATGDQRVLAPALRDLGVAQARAGQRDAALSTLRRALEVAGGDAGVRRDVYEARSELYRSDNRLGELIAELEKRTNLELLETRVLGGLYEETGQVARAIETYRRVIARDARDVDTRRKLVGLYELAGDLDAAIAGWEGLVRASPHNPDPVFRLVEALLQRGERARALRELGRLEARAGNDEQVLAAVADYYERLEEKARSLALLQRLSQLGAQDPTHWVTLGERYWADGNKTAALEAWQRLRGLGTDRARALTALGEVLLQHGLVREGLAAFRDAVQVGVGTHAQKRALALALERAGAQDTSAERSKLSEEARKIWETLLASAGTDAQLAREARQHLVTGWALAGDLAQRTGPLARRFRGTPRDLEAGRLLAEALVRLKRWRDAERTLFELVTLAPGDVASLTQLERVLTQQRRSREALDVLKKLVSADPKRSREYWQRMSELAAEIYADEEAVTYAARAVELAPDDAEAQRRLGQMYRRRQDVERAIVAYRAAIAKNDRLFPAYLELAELLVGQGALDEADLLLRRVVRACPDEELVARAARASLQLHLGRGTTEALERELLPLALASGSRTLHRRLLVELYGALAFPLIAESRSADAAAAARAKDSLRRLGERAVKPLLDALGDDRSDQQRVAIELLAHLESRGAGPALIAFARGPAPVEVRARAVHAAAGLEDPTLLPRLRELVEPSAERAVDAADPVTQAGAFAIARLRGPEAARTLKSFVESEVPLLRTAGALGAARSGLRELVPALSRIVSSSSSGGEARAAAAFALGELHAKSEVLVLTELVASSAPETQAAALVALARLAPERAVEPIAEAFTRADDGLLRAAVWAAALVSEPKLTPPSAWTSLEQGKLSFELSAPPAEVCAQALVRFAEPLGRAAAAQIRTSPERARWLAEALTSPAGERTFRPLVADPARLPAQQAAETRRAAQQLAAAVRDSFGELTRHPDPDVRIVAVRFLAGEPRTLDRNALARVMRDPEERVRSAAFEAMLAQAGMLPQTALIDLLEGPAPWPIRTRAAEVAEARLAREPSRELEQALTRLAERDAFALVREAATRALRYAEEPAAKAALDRIRLRDPEPRVRSAAELAARGREPANTRRSP
jgi:tetratricopeptide (TPR) repeat protein/HEAT repeat protein